MKGYNVPKRSLNYTAMMAALVEKDWSTAEPLVSLYVNKEDCWLWKGRLNYDGYVRLNYLGKGCSLHRLVLSCYTGRQLKGEQVHHICTVRHCVNPEHLQLVTQMDNLAEMHQRGWYIRRIKELEAENQILRNMLSHSDKSTLVCDIV